PSFHSRIRSLTMRQRLTLLLPGSIRSRRQCSTWLAYSQNIRTRLLTGDYASTIIRASACLLLPSHPYSTSREIAKSKEGGSGLETPAGIYHGNRRSGTIGTQ